MPKLVHRLAVVACTTAGVLVTAPATAATPKDVRAKPLAFTATEIPGNVASFPEPFIALTDKDHVLICGPAGSGAGIVRSTDWVNFTRIDVEHTGGGGDCDLAVGPDKAVYVSDLQLVATSVNKSIDGGASFAYQETAESIEQDREWLATDPLDGSIVYLAYHDLSLEAEIVAKSVDGGRHFTQHAIVSNDPQKASDTFPNTFSGPIRVDPTDHNRLYVVYAISSAGTNLGECTTNPTNCPFGSPEQIMVARSTDGGATWTNRVAMSGPPGSVLGNLFPSLTVDRAGTLYAAAAGHLPDANGTQVNGMFISVSTDQGQTWSGPIKVNASDKAVVFPAVVAGRSGALDVAWIESTSTDNHDANGDWSVHFAQSHNARGAAPTFHERVGPIVHHGEVCTTGITCAFGGDRSLADFMGIALDSFGYAHMVVASNAVGGQHVLYWRQDAGPSLLGKPCEQDGPRCAYRRPGPRR